MNKIVYQPFCMLIAVAAWGLEVQGTLTGDHEWTQEQSPIAITDHVVIPVGSSLKIRPGVRVECKGYYHILVRGVLEAVGSVKNPIVFTREPRLPSKDLWKGLVLYGEKCSAVLSYCSIEHAFRNLCWKATVTVQSNVFRSNNYGFYCSNTKKATIIHNRFYENIYGIYCDYSSPTIHSNEITKNEFGLYCIFSSAPLVGQNTLKDNLTENVFLDDSMGKNEITARNQYIWSLVMGIF